MKTPGLIFMTIIYISKVATLQVGVVVVTTNVLILEMYSWISSRIYSCLVSFHLFPCSRQINNKGRCFSFKTSKGVTWLRGSQNYLRRRKRQIPSPLQQLRGRKLLIQVDPIVPVDIPRDFAVGHKRPVWAWKTLQEAEGHATPQGTSRNIKNISLSWRMMHGILLWN